ncbi:unnamed protein product [Vitrella brassicaformis CCMP3155]|uniref:C-type lectin domain-containing protein n=3 Tax=Vitrella brassicaformis TaxID=1169539 RepID=A0A0G4EE44_VITBC|nr:unnamed protein product [Vitrella brassicaformis CCMP3155]|eukprot:CEL94247.1 unnamed protein product [Vitrella brassicaformis CCMP3155]
MRLYGTSRARGRPHVLQLVANVLLVVLLSGSPAWACPDDTWTERGGSCYKSYFFATDSLLSGKSWTEANEHCMSEGGTGAALASVRSPSENALVLDLAQQMDQECWVGLRKYRLPLRKAGWRWIDSTANLDTDDYVNWGDELSRIWRLLPPQEKCTTIRPDGWGARTCWGPGSRLSCFVCEAPADPSQAVEVPEENLYEPGRETDREETDRGDMAYPPGWEDGGVAPIDPNVLGPGGGDGLTDFDPAFPGDLPDLPEVVIEANETGDREQIGGGEEDLEANASEPLTPEEIIDLLTEAPAEAIKEATEPPTEDTTAPAQETDEKNGFLKPTPEAGPATLPPVPTPPSPSRPLTLPQRPPSGGGGGGGGENGRGDVVNGENGLVIPSGREEGGEGSLGEGSDFDIRGSGEGEPTVAPGAGGGGAGGLPYTPLDLGLNAGPLNGTTSPPLDDEESEFAEGKGKKESPEDEEPTWIRWVLAGSVAGVAFVGIAIAFSFVMYMQYRRKRNGSLTEHDATAAADASSTGTGGAAG